MSFTNPRVEHYRFNQIPILRNDGDYHCFWGKNLYNYENYSQLQQWVVNFKTILSTYLGKDWSDYEFYPGNVAHRGHVQLKSLIDNKKHRKSSDTLTPEQLYKITDWRHQIVQFLLKFWQANQLVRLDIGNSMVGRNPLRSHLNPIQPKESQL